MYGRISLVSKSQAYRPSGSVRRGCGTEVRSHSIDIGTSGASTRDCPLPNWCEKASVPFGDKQK